MIAFLRGLATLILGCITLLLGFCGANDISGGLDGQPCGRCMPVENPTEIVYERVYGGLTMLGIAAVCILIIVGLTIGTQKNKKKERL